ncbi:MAG: resolvase [Bacteroidetes bacterium]|nr:MAG: resolvase [Bacteroidota bacterium]
MNKIIGYCRISSSDQNLDTQKQLLLEYAQKNRMLIDEIIESESSSRLSYKERKIDELLSKLDVDDILLVVELSRLGRSMLEILNIINELTLKGTKIIFIRQPELSTNSLHGKLLTSIYAYFAESEREFISNRTKEALRVKKMNGMKLGRPVGSGSSKLDEYKVEIEALINNGSSKRFIAKRYDITEQGLFHWLRKNNKINSKTK